MKRLLVAVLTALGLALSVVSAVPAQAVDCSTAGCYVANRNGEGWSVSVTYMNSGTPTVVSVADGHDSPRYAYAFHVPYAFQYTYVSLATGKWYITPCAGPGGEWFYFGNSIKMVDRSAVLCV